MAAKAQILVTGGGGYVGSHCVLELLAAGYDVIALDNFVNAVRDPTGVTDYPESLLRVQKLAGDDDEAGRQCETFRGILFRNNILILIVAHFTHNAFTKLT